MKKSPANRNRLMATLMISSQLLLTGFVIYWLLGQYQEERTRLQSQLEEEYFMIHDQLVDSLLMERLVLPSLDDHLSMEVRVPELDQNVTITDSQPTVVMLKQFFAEVSDQEEENEEGIVTIHMNASALPDTGTIRQDVTLISDEERMVRSVKLFINENPAAFQNDTGINAYALKLDSFALKQNMESTLAGNDWKFDLQWPGGELNQASLDGLNGMVIYGDPVRFLPAIQIQKFNSYLLASIAPQILFGLILLLLSGSAMLFAYRSLRKQQALNRLRNDFVGNISHELKTPVSTVKVALEALRTFDLQKDPRVSAEYLEMAASELDRLEQLVGKVLHHELLDNPTLVLEKSSCHPGQLVRSALQSMDIPIKDAGASITIKEEGESCHILVDQVYVEGVLINLIDNSLKYAGKQAAIEIHVQCTPSTVNLSVMDRGPGISEEYKKQIFKKFFRIPSGDRHDVKGYGLGLNFAAQVMAKHHGSISFHNRDGGGSIFTLLFPKTEE